MKKALFYSLVLALIVVLVILVRFLVHEPLTEIGPGAAPQTRTTLGFIRSIDPSMNDGITLTFDDAVWLTGETAERAAIRAGRCSETKPASHDEYLIDYRADCIPNGYFIENTNETPQVLSVDPAAEIIMETYETGEPGDKLEYLDIESFMKLIGNPDLHWNKLPYHVTTQHGVVTKIVEQYIP